MSIILFASCVSDIPSTYENESTEDELIYFFNTFESEAAKRGIQIDLSNHDLTAEINEIHEEHVAGSCAYSSHNGNHITIDQGFWNNADFLDREMVVFHELGHCVLARGHREDEDENGSCLSIMQSGTLDCILRYNEVNRTYYLDELFFNSN